MKTLRNRIAALVLGLMLGTLAFAGLETGTYISDLVITNPTSSDLASQGDDHIRLIKSTVKATFPNINAAVTTSDEELNIIDGLTSTASELNILDGATLSTTELNYVDGVTSAIQTQLNAKASTSHTHATADVTSGTFADARISSSSVTQHLIGGLSVQIRARNIGSKAGTEKTLSNSAATGGSDGDIWYRY